VGVAARCAATREIDQGHPEALVDTDMKLDMEALVDTGAALTIRLDTNPVTLRDAAAFL
jgi:hypothetical protein